MATRAEAAVDALNSMIGERLRKGEDRLPPESELAAELGVSRATLRQALADLEADGAIRRQRKVGTTILRASNPGAEGDEPPLYPLDVIWSFPQFFEAASLPYEIESVSVMSEPADAATAKELEVPKGTTIYRVRRVFLVRGVRAIVAEHRLPQLINGRRARIEALTAGIASYLREIEMIDITTVENRVSAISADLERAKELGVRRSAPLLHVRLRLRATVDGESRSIVTGSLIVNPELVQLGATAATPGGTP